MAIVEAQFKYGARIRTGNPVARVVFVAHEPAGEHIFVAGFVGACFGVFGGVGGEAKPFFVFQGRYGITYGNESTARR
jgi:hypothetical protein